MMIDSNFLLELINQRYQQLHDINEKVASKTSWTPYHHQLATLDWVLGIIESMRIVAKGPGHTSPGRLELNT